MLVSVKASSLASALEDAAPAVGPHTAVVPFLNGIAHLDVLNTRFGAPAVLGGVVKVVTMVDDDGDIVRLDPLAMMAIGEQDGRYVSSAEGDRAGVDRLRVRPERLVGHHHGDVA